MSEYPETQYAISDGLSIAYNVWGAGSQDLVLVPGIISHLEALQDNPQYVRLMHALSANFRVITFDKRGNGMSDRISGAPTLDERAHDIDAVMDAANVQRASLIGISEGGPISIVYAARYPEKVSNLVLCGSFAIGRLVNGDITEADLKDISAQFMENWGKLGGVHPLSNYGPGPEDPEGQAFFKRFERLSATPSGIVGLINLSSRIDIRGVLPSVQQPTLVLRREHEPIPAATAEMLADLIPNATYRQLPGDQHIPFRGNVEDYINAILEFLSDREMVIHTPVAGQRVLASVLFTDIVGSTEHQVRLGDDTFRELMDRHDDLSKRQIERCNGRFIHSTGDGLLATFASPSDAITCAMAIRDAVSGIDLTVRAGVHTGEIELRGEDISGISVNIASRIADLAEEHEILTSDLTRQLMIGSNSTFEERGNFELKGVPGSWPLYAASL
jgi:class 3 adenylate cyclase/predicted alpha/beta hydrolase